MAQPRTKTRDFPFTEGQREDADAKVLPDGYVTRVRNMRLRADARWGVRHDFDAQNALQRDGTTVSMYDLAAYDDRLLGFGGLSLGLPGDLYGFVGQPTHSWHPTFENSAASRLNAIRNLRDMGRPTLQTFTAMRMDVAAGGGLVCAVHGQNGTFVHVFDPTTDTTLLYADVGTLGFATFSRPRVVFAGGKFWIMGINVGTIIAMCSYTIATGVFATATSPVGAGAGIDCYDARVRQDGNGFWVVAHRSTPSTTIVPVSATGVAGAPIVGTAVASTYVTVCDTSTRVHVVNVATATLIASLNSYTLAGALSTGPSSLFSAGTNERQPGLMPVVNGGTESAVAIGELTRTPERNTVIVDGRSATAHAVTYFYSWLDSSLGTKPWWDPNAVTSVGFGGVQAEGPKFSNFAATFGGGGQLIGAYKDKFAAFKPPVDTTPNVGYDSTTGKYYWANLVDEGDGHPQPVVTEFEYCSRSRRQTADMGGNLYIAGGQIYRHDGRGVCEAGFCERPTILSAVQSNGAGLLPSSTTLLVCATFEWRDAKGNFDTSRPSEVTSVVMGAADDTITVEVSGPHSLRKNTSTGVFNGIVTVVIWRSVAGIAQLRRAATATLVNFGDSLQIVLTGNDDSIRANAVIYTQAGRGVLGAIEPHESPLPAEFICRFGKRLLTAGGPNRYRAQVSKELFPGEPVVWSGAAGFFVDGAATPINGVASLGNRGILFTAQKIYQFSGDGPNDNGEGKYTDATEIESSTGLRDWRSIVVTPLGLMLQGTDLNLWLLPLDGSPPVPFYQVQDTLAAFPVVTSASIGTDEQLVTFTCMNVGLTDSRLVHFDLRAKTWIVDDFATATPIVAAITYQSKLVYLNASGVVFRERTTHPAATFIEHGITTGDFKLAGLSGWKEFCSSQFLGEIRGDVNLKLRISYDAGSNWADGKTHLLRVVSDPVGKIIRRSWGPTIRKCERFRLDFQALTPGAPSEGLVFNSHSVEYVPVAGSARIGASKRG